MDNLILAEHDWQVRDLLQHDVPASGKWVALGPYAMHELKKQGINYVIPEDFYDEVSYMELRDYAQKVTRDICEAGDRILWENCPDLKDRQIKVFHHYVIDLSILIDGILWRILQLERIINSLKPHRIYSHRYLPDIKLDSRLFFRYLDNLYARVLEFMNVGAQIHWYQDSIPQISNLNNNHAIDIKSLATSFLMKNLLVWNFYSAFKRKGLWGIYDLLNFSRKPEVIIYGGEYNWKYCKDSFSTRGFNLLSFNDSMFLPRHSKTDHQNKRYQDLIATFTGNKQFRALFIYQDRDWYPLIKDRINHLVYFGTKDCIKVYDDIKNKCKSGRVKAFLVAICNSPAAFSAAFAAKSSNVPVFTQQHGCEGYYKHFLVPYMDLINSDYFLTYGNGVNKTYESFARKFGTKLVATGSVKSDTLRGKNGSDISQNLRLKIEKLKQQQRKIILYATTLYMHNFTTFRFTQGGMYSDRLLYKEQRELIGSLLKLVNAGIIFKLIPVPYVHKPDPPMLLEPGFLPEHTLVIKSETSFLDLLPLADIILLDEPSTTLIESAVLKKPIFLLITDPKMFVDGSLELIKRRVVCSERTHDLVEFLNQYLLSGEYPADINDRSFAREYSLFTDDGRSLHRVMDTVQQEIYKRNCF